jgi:uncharacterized protein (UPF0335 family)
MDSLIKQLVKENMIIEAAKQGTPEELAEWLELLPVDETAKYLAEEIYQEILKYYTQDIKPQDKNFEYHPKEKCLKPYIVEIDFRISNNYPGIGYAEENYIQVKYLNKDAREYYPPYGGAERLQKVLYNIIKHECGHFYLRQRGVEECLYHTHPDGMEKYYHDRQEIVLHSREIFDTLDDNYPNWPTWDMDKIISKLIPTIKNLPRHTNINKPFPATLQKKYLNFILNAYIKPRIEKINQSQKEEMIGTQTLIAVGDKLRSMGYDVKAMKANNLQQLIKPYPQQDDTVYLIHMEDEEEYSIYFTANDLNVRVIYDKEEKTYWLNMFENSEQRDDEIVSKYYQSIEELLKDIK